MLLQLNAKTIAIFRSKLCRWYDKNRRPLPWRIHPTPYRVWISEIMLQQTQAKTVIPYYDRFLKRFPDITSLARASEETVLTLWSGLGYYSRARNLLRAARQIIELHNGIFPTNNKTVLSLPGIGPYTAGAICSIAFNQPQPIVEGNIRRVITRLKGIQKHIPERYFWDQMATWVPEKKASEFNQAMMELGAIICQPIQPRCSQCPVLIFCRAKKLNLQNSIPLSKSSQATKKIVLAILVLKRKKNVLLKRQEDSLIPGRWGLPYRIVSTEQSPLETAVSLNGELSKVRAPVDYVSEIRHSITHHRITAHIFTGEAAGRIARLDMDRIRIYWATDAQQRRMITSSLFRKALEAAGPGMN